MEASAFMAWHGLHLRDARGEVLSVNEQAEYNAGVRELDSEVHVNGDLARLRQLKARVAQLEAENSRLRTERKELVAQIARVEARLSTETLLELGKLV